MSLRRTPLQVGIIGAGAWAAEIASCIGQMRGVRLTAISNRSVEKARKLAAEHNIPEVFEDYDELCRSSTVDAVAVVTHESAHSNPTRAALNAGKDVFVEKPMADSVEAARQMAQCAKETGRILMPGHLLRFEKRCQAAKARLAKAGPVRAIRCFQHRPKRLYESYCRPHLAFSLMIHHLDVCRWFVGCSVVRVACQERFFIGPNYPSNVWATLEFENRAIATLQSGWVFESDAPSFGEDGLEIVTEHERINLEFSNEGYEARLERTLVRPEFSYRSALQAELEYWLCCIEQRTQPTIVTPDDGIEAVALAELLVAHGNEQRRRGQSELLAAASR